MGRIRSVHPGLYTDEAIASCSPTAGFFFIGLGTEADDFGVFEWKPVRLKMRLMPAHNVDCVELLADLEEQNLICRFEHEGRTYGAIRNFCRHQRPKRVMPGLITPLPPDVSQYVDLSSRTPRTGAVKGDEEEDGDGDQQPPDPPMGDGPPVKPDLRPPKSRLFPQKEREGEKDKEDSVGEGGTVGDSIDPPAPPSGGPPPLALKPEPLDRDPVEAAFAEWNALADEVDLPKAQVLTKPRRAALRQRLHEAGGIEGWRGAMARIRGSPFLRGENDRGWRADLDFVLQAKSFTRLLEGAYDGKPGGSGRGSFVDGIGDFLRDVERESGGGR
ncbi:MAG: hypothetical protein AB7P02_23990 [Alphaproteobacteria bacterium]